MEERKIYELLMVETRCTVKQGGAIQYHEFVRYKRETYCLTERELVEKFFNMYTPWIGILKTAFKDNYTISITSFFIKNDEELFSHIKKGDDVTNLFQLKNKTIKTYGVLNGCSINIMIDPEYINVESSTSKGFVESIDMYKVSISEIYINTDIGKVVNLVTVILPDTEEIESIESIKLSVYSKYIEPTLNNYIDFLEYQKQKFITSNPLSGYNREEGEEYNE